MFFRELYVAIMLCLIECEVSQCVGRTEKPKNRKLEEKRLNDPKRSKLIIKNDKMSARQNLIKVKEIKNLSIAKWPALLRQGKRKESIRSTKMDMMQEQYEHEESTRKDDLLSMEDNKSDFQMNPIYFSSYSIKQQLAKIAKEIPNSNITIDVIGRTLEYQDIVMLRISEYQDSKYFRADDHKYAEEVTEKKIIFIVHGLSVMGMDNLYCLSTPFRFRILLSYYTSYLDKFDIFLIPIANPDGYTYIRSLYQLWNKNVAPQAECPGVALDRNFDVAWSRNRSVSSCSQQYPGPSPFSEAETRAVRDIFHKYAHKIVAYLNVHAGSYDSSVFRGDAVLYPKGYSDTAVDDDRYIDLKGEIDEAIRNASYQVISVAVDTLYNWYGQVTGTSVDYASTVYGIPFAMELVMQLYEDDEETDAESFSDLALTEVWKRVIDVIMSNIWKTIHGTEVN